MTERNWSGTVEFGARAVHRPASIAEAQRLVADAPRIRALGTRHSFNDVADTDGDLISLVDVPTEITVEGDAVTVTGGTRYGELAPVLHAAGRALHNMGSLPHISIAGATATGTHGSGLANGTLSTAVREIERIAPDGELWRIRRGEPGFDGSVVALGALGVVTRVVLDTEPTYDVTQTVYLDLPWDPVLERFDDVLGAGYSTSLFLDWNPHTIGQMWVKRRVDEGTAPDAPFGARASERVGISPTGELLDNVTQQGGVPGPWLERLPHFRLDAEPSAAGDEIQSEFFVDRADSTAALLAVRELAAEILPALIVSEIRTIAADDLWLSGAFARPTTALHFTWKKRPDLVAPLVARLRAVLAPFAARPHWGKVFDQAQPVAELYPRVDEFRTIVRDRDPGAKFSSAFTRRHLGV